MEETSEKSRAEKDRGRPSRILVIDDEEVIHASLTRILSRQGHEVDAVLSAAEGLERLAGGGYDLVISDLMMPEMNGIQLLEQLKSTGIEVPVLMITGYPTIRTAMQSLRLGAVDYLAKPFTRQELLGPVNRTLRRAAGGTREPAAPAAGGADSPEPRPSPGDRFFLREHSWALYEQDGTVTVGIEASFLDAIDPLESIDLPRESDLVEQGFVCFRLRTSNHEQHNVFAPLTGQVVEVNRTAIEDPSCVTAETWLVRLIPHRVVGELALLLRG